MSYQVHLSGPYRLRIAADLFHAASTATIRRLLRGSRRPTWNWWMELSTESLKKHLSTAFQLPDVLETRRYLDSFVLEYSSKFRVHISRETQPSFRGDWFTPPGADPNRILFYLHGGGYSFFPKAYASFISWIASELRSRTFALDYRLSPEHRFPAQLEDALHAYQWLLAVGHRPENIVFAGDSAGGHLALTLLIHLRDQRLPLPALTLVLSPATDFVNEHPSLSANEPFDWIDYRMLTKWAGWFCEDARRCEALVSPIQADLRGLPPIYIQAGESEILFDSIQEFADRARQQRVDIVFESWRDMNHVFQMFGPNVPQSAEALRRLAHALDVRLRSQPTETLANSHP